MMMPGFPAVVEFFKYSAATLREACVAELAAVVSEYEPACCFDSLPHCRRALTGYALVALAVIVGAHVEVDMVVAVVPTDNLVVCTGT